MKNFIKNYVTKEIAIGLAVTLVAVSFFGIYRYYLLYQDNITLEAQIKSLEASLKHSRDVLAETQKENTNLNQSLLEQSEKVNSLVEKVVDISGALGTLEKLSKTDKELLKKYSKVYFLNENYIPSSLSEIDNSFALEKDKNLKIHTEVKPHLEKMLLEASSTGFYIKIISAYRSYSEQISLKSNYKVTFGAGTANAFSADQGYSEHQLGTTVDFTTVALGASFSKFDQSNAYKWLLENAYKYGFVLSYPKNNKYYIYEPWHWRFVGISLATKLSNEKQNFYDLDQREIDPYLINIFNN